MQSEQAAPIPSAPAPPVTGRARVRVAALDPGGAAVADVVEWITRPSDGDWAAVHGPRAGETPLPERCAFVGGLPGELAEVELRWTTPRPGRRHARYTPPPGVRVCAVLEAAPDRVAAPCPVFGECGGCQLQHLAYEEQLAWKTARVAALLRDAGLGAAPVAPALACPDPWHYRNHMRFSVDREGRAGLTARGSRRVIPLRACSIAHPLIERALAALADLPLPRPQLLVRCGAATGEVLVQPAPEGEALARLRAAGLDPHGDALTERLRLPGIGEDRPPEVSFRIRPSSFFQTNTAQAERMGEAVLAGLPLGPDATLVDAYCGVGTFATLLAPHAGRIIAVEESASAVRDAAWNLRALPNVTIVQAKVEDWLPRCPEHIDGLVIDPPRAGCARPVLAALAARRVPRVVYVSCDPATLARDLAQLCRAAAAYRILAVQPLDMFPQTAHIECVTTLEAV